MLGIVVFSWLEGTMVGDPSVLDTGVHIDTRYHQVARQLHIITIKFSIF